MAPLEDLKLAVIGLGYVGLPLAVEFGKVRPVVGYDIDVSRVAELVNGIDRTREVSAEELRDAISLVISTDDECLKDCDVFIVTVPTPIDDHKNPDLGPLIAASELVGSVLNRGSVVVYESTVFPGATEDVCVPILEAGSGLKYNEDFFCGYSPERINPGDKTHRLPSIKKITSGSTPQVADLVDSLYQQIITAGTFKAQSIAVAEAAKVIENTQRDLNIALINELAIIFNKMGIDTEAVLDAAETKWNFIPFRPGLVGGHCIGVDPYYLTHKSQAIGYNPEVILAGRRLNDGMSRYVAAQLVKEMSKKAITINDSSVLVMGFTFKEDCPDVRNTKVLDLVCELQEYGCSVEVYDPVVQVDDVIRFSSINFLREVPRQRYDAVLVAVGHADFRLLGANAIREFLNTPGVLYDLKSIFSQSESDVRL